jgi:hypothetical protein
MVRVTLNPPANARPIDRKGESAVILPKRAADYRLDTAARSAAQAVKAAGSHSDALERLLRRVFDYLNEAHPREPAGKHPTHAA